MALQIAELIDVQHLAGQELLNIFHYFDTGGTADLLTLEADYVDNVLPLFRGTQSAAVSHDAIRTRLVYPTASLPTTTSITPPILGDDASTNPLASCDALSMQFFVGPTTVLSGGFTGHIRRSGCRQGVPTEGMVNGNTVSSAAASSWAATFVELRQPGTDLWFLCVVSFLIGNHTPHGSPRARSSTVTSYAPITGSSEPSPSTQNTRKVLRGRTR